MAGKKKKQKKQHNTRTASSSSKNTADCNDSKTDAISKKKQNAKPRHHDKTLYNLSMKLKLSGFFIKQVKADGNCLFRAFADQITGDTSSHLQFRLEAIEYLEKHEDEFKFFIEDDEPFETYVSRMSKPGAWGGHLELHLLSIIYEVNIIVHQSDEASYIISNFPDDVHCIQLSFHNDAHYNSVRLLKESDGSSPVQKLTMQDIINGTTATQTDEKKKKNDNHNNLGDNNNNAVQSVPANESVSLTSCGQLDGDAGNGSANADAAKHARSPNAISRIITSAERREHASWQISSETVSDLNYPSDIESVLGLYSALDDDTNLSLYSGRDVVSKSSYPSENIGTNDDDMTRGIIQTDCKRHSENFSQQSAAARKSASSEICAAKLCETVEQQTGNATSLLHEVRNTAEIGKKDPNLSADDSSGVAEKNKAELRRRRKVEQQALAMQKMHQKKLEKQLNQSSSKKTKSKKSDSKGNSQNAFVPEEAGSSNSLINRLVAI